MSISPDVSVIIPTFNRLATLPHAIDSALSQEGVSLEVVIADDSSTDGTIDWVRATYQGRPVHVVENARNQGPAGARNTGILNSSGVYIAFLDSDDVFLPDHLAKAVAAFTEHSSIDVVFGESRYKRGSEIVDYMGPNYRMKIAAAPIERTDPHLYIFSRSFFDYLLQAGCFFNLSTVVLKRSVANALMNDELRIGEDFEFWARLAQNHRFAALRSEQIVYYLHEDNISFTFTDNDDRSAPELLKSYQAMLEFPGLTKRQTNSIKNDISKIYFRWAYRKRKSRRHIEAFKLHCLSTYYGNRLGNISGIIKVILSAVFPFTNNTEANRKKRITDS